MTTPTSTRATVSGAHLVGSVNLPTAEEVFGAVAGHLGEHITHIPDGEVGERYYWLQFQTRRFDRTPGLVRLGDTPYLIRGEFDQRPSALDGTVAAEDLVLPSLGYADAAIESFATFARLRDDGVIAPGTRFQVSLPTRPRWSACSSHRGTVPRSSPSTRARSTPSSIGSRTRSRTTRSRCSGTPRSSSRGSSARCSAASCSSRGGTTCWTAC